MVQTDEQKARACIKSIPLNIISENEQVNITINIKVSTYHILKQCFGG